MLRKGEKSKDEGTDIRSQRAGASGGRGLSRSRFASPLMLGAFEDPFSFVEAFDRQFEEMRRNMESLMFPTGSVFALGPGSGALRRGAETALAARVDLQDNGKEYVLTAELPGFSKDEVDLEVSDEGITLSATRSQTSEQGSEDSGFLARERSYSALRRSVGFPEVVVADRASAALKDGILTVTVPKKEPTPEPKPRKLKVQ